MRVKLVEKIKNVILAVPKEDIDNKIKKIANKYNIKIFYGSSKNVLKRAQSCCRRYNLKYFIRVNADRPFLDFEFINKVLSERYYLGYDLITNNKFKKAPSGLTFEMIKAKSLLKISTKNNEEKEHICNHFYNYESKFKILDIKSKRYEKFKVLNFSLDNKKDLIKITKVYKKLEYNFDTKIYKIYQKLKNII